MAISENANEIRTAINERKSFIIRTAFLVVIVILIFSLVLNRYFLKPIKNLVSYTKIIKEKSRKKSNIEIWNKSHVDHPFIIAMRKGNLDIEKFKFFMIQDYLFLIDYCKVISLAVTKSTDLNSMNHFSSLLNETLNSEMQLHRDFCFEIGISNNELESASAMPATLSYTNYLLSTAYNNSIEEIVASLLPCQWGYDEIGRRLERKNQTLENSFHSRWIKAYNDVEYREITNWLINYVDSIQQNVDNKVANLSLIHI